jgi:hypothetical protein
MSNFTFDYDHQFWISLVIQDVWKSFPIQKSKSNPIQPKMIFKNGSTHVSLLMKYIKTYNNFENVW